MLVKPVEGRKIRDPRTMRFVPLEGLEVPSTDPFWVQRVAEGDLRVVVIEPEKKAAQPLAPASPDHLETGELRTAAPSQEKSQ